MPFDLKTLMALQLGLEAVLVLLLVALLLRSKKERREADPARMPAALQDSMENFLAESEKISAAFSANLKDKKDLSADLILKLDRRLGEYRALLQETEARYQEARNNTAPPAAQPAQFIPPVTAAPAAAPAAPPGEPGKANPAAPEVRAMVLQLARKGHSPEEIAAKARLHRGEVELIIDLERQFNL